MTTKQPKKIYYVLQSCKGVIKSFAVQGYEGLVFNAFFYRNGKKMNSLEKADPAYFADLIKEYEKNENPDKIKIEFRHTDNNTLLWSKEFILSEPQTETVNDFKGLGEAEVDEIVTRKINDYKRLTEAQTMREQLEEALERNQELAGELEEASAQLEAKKKMEYYAGLLGMAVPVLGKMLGNSPAGQALGFLSGVENEPEAIEAPENQDQDNRTAITVLITDYMKTLDNTTLGKLYSIMCEFNGNGALIPQTLEYLNHQKEYNHEKDRSNNSEDNL